MFKSNEENSNFSKFKDEDEAEIADFNPFWRFWPFITLAKFDFSYGHFAEKINFICISFRYGPVIRVTSWKYLL